MKFSWIVLSVAATLTISPVNHPVRAAETADPLWHKTCAKDGDKPSCIVEQFAVVMPQKKVALHIAFALVPQHADQVRMTVAAPLGVILEPGLTLNIDDQKPITLPFERCTGQGCLVTAILDKTATEHFVHGKTLTARYTVQDKNTADIPIRLPGLGDALKSLAQ